MSGDYEGERECRATNFFSLVAFERLRRLEKYLGKGIKYPVNFVFVC